MFGSVLVCGIDEGRCGERCGKGLGEVWGRCGKVCWDVGKVSGDGEVWGSVGGGVGKCVWVYWR